MNKCLVKATVKVTGMHPKIKGKISIYLRGDVSGLSGYVTGLRGDVSGLSGDVSGLRGYVTGLSGDVTGLSGDVSGLSGDVTGLRGDVTDDALTTDERKRGVNVQELVNASELRK